jgi:hypothetical protein
MNNSKSLAIICCYGYNDSNRSDQELRGLNQYFSKVSEYLTQHAVSIAAGVVCGGYSIPEMKLSEAESCLELIRPNLPSDFTLILNTSSLNHLEHIAIGLTTARKSQFDSVTILCDKNFIPVVTSCCVLLLENYLSYEIIGFNREDIHPDADKRVQEQKAKDPELAVLANKWREIIGP